MEEPIYLEPGQPGFATIGKFLKANSDAEDYTLSIYDIMSSSTMEIDCKQEEMLQIISFVSAREHSFPEWIGRNYLTDSFVVGMQFTRGCYTTPCIAKWDGSAIIVEYQL